MCDPRVRAGDPKEELVFLTPEWKGERYKDGRPKVPDEFSSG